MRTLGYLFSFLSLLACASGALAQTVPQAAPNPIVLQPAVPIDNLQVLMAAAASRPSSATVPTEGPNKHLYVQYSGTESLQWNVSAPAAAGYHVFALVSAPAGQGFRLTNTSNNSSTAFTANGDWSRIDVGQVQLNAGISVLSLTRTGTAAGTVQIKSIELIRESDLAAFQSRVAAAHADTTWFSRAKYGLFFQYGSWGYPNNVGVSKSVDQQAQDFHVPSFVQMVKDTGAKYVIWSFSWWGYKPNMPIPTIDAVIGNGSYTAQRNLIKEIATALKAEGIGFMLYYHTGSEQTEANGWWQRQNYPQSTFPTRGTGDRTTFFNNWSAVLEDIGSSLGTSLDGIFFDDGTIYYPARFEELLAFARTGNPNRLVSWNNYTRARTTEFQDVSFGELEHGEVVAGSGPVGGNGFFTSGRNAGLLQHGMFPIERWNEWGIHYQNQKIPSATAFSDAQLISWVSSASTRGVPLSLNVSMYEDGTIADAALQQLYALRKAIYGTAPAMPIWSDFNNDWSGITYSGSWARAGNRNAGDYQNDVQYTANNGDSLTIRFSGVGVTVYGPMSVDDGYAKVTLDGVDVSTTAAYFAGAYSPQQHLIRFSHLSNGPHTLTLTKTGGSFLQIDKVSVASVDWVDYNNTWSGISYGGMMGVSGAWALSGKRGGGDFQDDLRYTSRNGNTVTVTFNGTGVIVYGPKSAQDAAGSVQLDGASAGMFSAVSNGGYVPQQEYARFENLSRGKHTLRLTKTSGAYLQIDRVSVRP